MANPTDALRAHSLLVAGTFGTLSTLDAESGHPYGSLVGYAWVDERAVFLLSNLAAHTHNLKADSRASLLVMSGDGEDPLDSERVCVIGELALIEGQPPRSEYLLVHENAARFVDFADFSFYQLLPTRTRYIGGFGRMSWLNAGALKGVAGE